MKTRSLLFAVLLVGCPSAADPDSGMGSDVPGADVPGLDAPGTDAPGTDAPGADVPTTDAGMVESTTLTFGPDTLAPGDERTQCIVLDAGNDIARQVRAIRTLMPQGSHHMIVYRTDDAVRTTPFSCFPFADGGSAIFIAETREEYLEYPSDASLHFAANQHIRIEVHEVNYTGAPITFSASVTFEYYPRAEPAHTPVQFLFTGNMSLSLPPRMTTTVTSFHNVSSGARVFGLTSHTHALGTYASIHRGRSETMYTELLHESMDWANPVLDRFAPPLTFAPGEGLRLECEYMNTTSSTVGFGLDFDDEMCFLWAYYY